MENLPFVLWLLGWPLLDKVFDAIDKKCFNKDPDKKDKSDGVVVVIWIIIAIILYK